jgi:Xaa-Pro aminopeptidase
MMRADNNWNNSAFSLQEHINRLKKARLAMAEAGLAGCICTSPELLYYFTGYEAYTHHVIGSQAVVIPAEEAEPILIIRDGDVPQADETVVIGEVRPFRIGAVDISQVVREVAHEVGLIGKRVGLDFSGITTNGALTLALKSAVVDSHPIDCWRLLGRLRTVLSDREIAYVKEAARYANAGIAAFYSNAQPNMTEIELAAEMEYAMRSLGSDYPAIPTYLSSGERSPCMHGMPTSRRMRRGDLIHTEFSGVARRYQCVTMGSLILGEPTPRMVELSERGKAAFDAGLAAAHLGGTFSAMEIAYRASLERSNLISCCLMRFGVGISAAYPPLWENQIAIQHESDDVIQAGMVFYIHSCLQSFDDRIGVILGGSFLVTDNGPERLDDARMDLVPVEN